MRVFVDTSAFYALMDQDDRYFEEAQERYGRIRDQEHTPVTHNYILVETAAILQNRIGMNALDDFVSRLTEPVSTLWVDEEIHKNAMNSCLNNRERSVSFVDFVSFGLLRKENIRIVFGFDDDFSERGFELFE